MKAEVEARWPEEPMSVTEAMVAVHFQIRPVDWQKSVHVQDFLETVVVRESAYLRLVNERHDMVRTMKD